MRCAYCNRPCDDRPVRYEAVCWECHRSRIGTRKPWWNRFRRWMATDTTETLTEGES